jgi:MFS family permease
MSTWFSASAVLPQLRAEWALSDSAAAWLTIEVQLGFVVGAVGAALLNLSDVIRPQRVILVGAILASLANGMIVFAPGPEIALPLRFLTGVFLAQVYPPALKVMSTWFREKRGTALTLQLALGFMFTVATIWLIPVLQDEFGWRWAFAFLAPGPLIGIAAMLRLRASPEAELIAGGRG